MLLSLQAALAARKVAAWVQSYNKGCTANMRQHLFRCHDAEEQVENAEKKQLTIKGAVERGALLADDTGMRVALCTVLIPTSIPHL